MSDSVVRAGESAARLEAAADAMLTEVASLPSDLITWKPADDVWSIMEILCHVAEFVPFWTSQTLQIVRRPDDQWGRLSCRSSCSPRSPAGNALPAPSRTTSR